jgi:hypothetical protein
VIPTALGRINSCDWRESRASCEQRSWCRRPVRDDHRSCACGCPGARRRSAEILILRHQPMRAATRTPVLAGIPSGRRTPCYDAGHPRSRPRAFPHRSCRALGNPRPGSQDAWQADNRPLQRQERCPCTPGPSSRVRIAAGRRSDSQAGSASSSSHLQLVRPSQSVIGLAHRAELL